MKIFSKLDKKVLIILITALVVILLIGFIVYKYISGSLVDVKNLTGGAQTEQNNTPQVQIQADGVQVQGENGGGTFSVCLDKCGDGVCQETDPNCGKGNGLNCICPENPQECPQDCK